MTRANNQGWASKIVKAHSTGLRVDVQYLRAFAVLAVVAYHYWPTIFVGGFIGVDVFFAISGYLITEHLLREFEMTRKINIVEFWSRRIRRLLPASLTVIAVSTLLTTLIVPKNLVKQFLDELAASTLYFENFKLASNSVDYLAAENIASPVQHFWSLGVEEQFYLVWPVVMVLAIGIATLIRIKNKRAVIFVAISAIVGLSLWSSVVETLGQNPAAYFVTNTRAWELGVGALIAVSGLTNAKKPVVATSALRVIGWIALFVTVFAFNKNTPFPGYSALLPVGASALLLTMDSSTNARLGGKHRALPSNGPSLLVPFKFIGDISYSIYLWHWPLLVLMPFALGHKLDPITLIVALGASIALGWISKRFIEDPTRNPKNRMRQPRFTILAAVAAMGVLLAVNYPIQNQIDLDAAKERNLGVHLYQNGTPCFGALAWDSTAFECKSNGLAGDFVTPTPASVKDDIPLKYKECQAPPYSKIPITCVLGVKGGTRVAIAGDSHSFMWIDALNEIALKQNWELHTFARASCPFSHVVWPRNFSAEADSCAIWNTNVDAMLAKEKPYKYLFTSLKSVSDYPIGSDPVNLALTGIQKSWQPLIDRGTMVVSIHDIPRPTINQAKCAIDNPTRLDRCKNDPLIAFDQKDWLYETVPLIKGSYRIDLTDYFCRKNVCPNIVGHTFVYRDGSHVSATYGRTLAPMLWQKIQQLAP